jgi:predicted nucleotidyltransferase
MEEILKEYRIDFAFLFGSYVGKNFREDSDIDIAIYGDFTPNDYFELLARLEEKSGRQIDLINLKKVDLNFAFEICITGKVFYVSNEELLKNYQMYITSMYLTLEEDRKIVLDKVKERGTVFGKSCI